MSATPDNLAAIEAALDIADRQTDIFRAARAAMARLRQREAAVRELVEAGREALGHLVLPGEKPLKGVEACHERLDAALSKLEGR